ncbi:hypothetical protein EDD85DRAFT_798716 [Armillaria nabsnona]|nr:hypothetical protein EDD85DRAFT_798716 [Armillaria nabsnona]
MSLSSSCSMSLSEQLCSIHHTIEEVGRVFPQVHVLRYQFEDALASVCLTLETLQQRSSEWDLLAEDEFLAEEQYCDLKMLQCSIESLCTNIIVRHLLFTVGQSQTLDRRELEILNLDKDPERTTIQRPRTIDCIDKMFQYAIMLTFASALFYTLLRKLCLKSHNGFREKEVDQWM